MKILYSAGNYSGANIFLSRFLKHTNHEVKILAYYNNHKYLHHIDWVTDALLSNNSFRQKEINRIFGLESSLPRLNPDTTLIVYNDLVDWGPDLIISDVEPISAYLSYSLGVDLWYCSPLLLLTGIEWEFTKSYLLQETINKINKLPEPHKCLINSPFCDILGRPFIKKGYEWIRPYYEDILETTSNKSETFETIETKLLKEGVLTTGESSFLSDIMYNGKNPIFLPKDNEQLLNAELASFYGFGFNIGQTNSLEFIKEKIENIKINNRFMNIQNHLMLDERI